MTTQDDPGNREGHQVSARDELLTTIIYHPWLPDHEGLYTGLCPSCPERQIHGGHNSPSHAGHLADAILAAGYTKPRIITTAAELDALPDGSVIRDAAGTIRERFNDLETTAALWYRTGSGGYVLSAQFTWGKLLPATVLHEPTP